jgi:hypothetical protein
MLTDAQKDDIRRHCGFPVFGNGISASPPSFGYRYYDWYLIIEYRMNNLSTNQELLLTTVYIPNCTAALNAIQTASTNLDTDRAAVWYHNKYEVRDRFNLYKLQCQLLIQFMGAESPGNLINGMRLTV